MKQAIACLLVLTCILGMRVRSLQAEEGTSQVQVTQFIPQNTVKGVRQVRSEFSKPVPAFGDPKAPDPFDINCPAAGKGRWADQQNWVYDFDAELPAGIRCVFKIKPGLKTLGGASLTGQTEFKFDTGGPAIKRTDPWEGNQVDEQQMFVLSLDAAATPESVLANAYFEVEGSPEKIGVNIVKDDPRMQNEAYRRAHSRVNLYAHKFGAPTRVGTQNAEPAEIVIQAKRRFPAEAKVTLVWGAGVQTPSGVSNAGDQTIQFTIRPDFVAKFNCERENAEAPCLPVSPMTMNFNAEVPWSTLKQIRLRAKDGPSKGKQWKPEGDHADDELESFLTLKGPFPENTHYEITLPTPFKDDANRLLANLASFPLQTSTGAFPPLVKFPGTFGILELKPEALLPVTVRNVEATLTGTQGQINGKVLKVGASELKKAIRWIKRVESAKREESVFPPSSASDFDAKPISIPRPGGEKAFEVIGIPFQEPGFYVVEFASEKLGASLLGTQAPMYVPTSVLVTNLSVHFKLGRESSLVWVTSLDDAKPVDGAQVAIRDCDGTEIASGKTDAKGILKIGRELPSPSDKTCQGKGEYSGYGYGFFVTAEKGNDFSFVHTSWDRGIEPWRFNMPGGYTLTPKYASTVFDRTLFRAGETVHMKHYFRKHTASGIIASDTLPKTIKISHDESNQTYTLPLKWRQGGVAETTWTIPKGSKLGNYSVSLVGEENIFDGTTRGKRKRKSSGYEWGSGSFRVEEYRVPLMRALLSAPTQDLVEPKEVPVDLSVEYLSGGPAKRLPVQVRHQLVNSGPIEFPEFDGFDFGTGKQRETEATASPDEDGEGLDMSAPAPESMTGSPDASHAEKQSLTLNETGAARAKISIPSSDKLRRLQVEVDYRDPNGETQTASRTLSLYPSSRLVGVKPENWVATKKSLKFQVAVADLHGKAIAGSPVNVEFLELKHIVHRKRLAGGFYAYDDHSELIRHGKACSGTTDEKGLLNCDSTPPVAGNLILEASTKDEGGRESFSTASSWVYDSEEWWFSQDDSDRIDLLPEKQRYEPGQTASFQVRMPFREATALVTVEREGILDSFVVSLSGKKPVIEVPIKASYAPNVFISALVLRGRVGDPQPTALVDLGKPAYKLGLSELKVGWRDHELQVTVKPSKDIYQVREKGRFKISVKRSDGEALPEGSEIALAAVDEGLLQLKPNESWNLLEHMMRRRGYEIETFTAQSEVVGKRHFGLKAVPSGGDGGKSPARQIMDSLLYWNGKVVLDKYGEAEIEFPMNDALTGFKVAAVANAAEDLFGTGYAAIQTTQDLMVLPGIPPLAREGDHLPLEFTLRNTTARSMKVDLEGKAAGLSDWPQQTIDLPAGDAKVLTWNVDIPVGATSIIYQVSAHEHGGGASDRVETTEKVMAATPVHVYQATLKQLDGTFELPVERPKNSIEGRGGIHVGLDSTLLTSLDGVRAYMDYYPYTCLEQRISKAVAMRDQKVWKGIVADLPSYLDSDGLARYFPSPLLQGSDILTAYIVSLSQAAGWDFPEALRTKMLSGLHSFVEGKITRISDLLTTDLTLRKLSALEALSRYGEADWREIGSLQIQPNLWPTSGLIDWLNFLHGAKNAPADQLQAKITEANQILHSRLNFQGTTMGFSTENIDQLWWMMVSTSENSNRLLLAAIDEPSWNQSPDDLGRLARGAIGRQSHGHWDTTTANAWGTLALERFAKKVESQKVAGTTSAELEAARRSVDWSKASHQEMETFAWPKSLSTLQLSHSGTGKPWATIQSLAAIPLTEPISSGYRLKKTLTPVEQKTSGKWSKGDIVRVTLEMESQSDMSWVVVNDPIPAGATILGSGLGNDSQIAASGEKSAGWAIPAFVERAFDGYRAYYEYVPKGSWKTEYTFRLNQAGSMTLPSTRIEAMYSPEMYGESPNDAVSVSN